MTPPQDIRLWPLQLFLLSTLLQLHRLFLATAITQAQNLSLLLRHLSARKSRIDEEVEECERAAFELYLLMHSRRRRRRHYLRQETERGFNYRGGMPGRPWRDPESGHWSASAWYRSMFSMTDRRFRRHFRMSKASFQYIVNRLRPRLHNAEFLDNSGPKPPIPYEYKILAVLWRFARGKAFASLATQFAISAAFVNKAVIPVSNAIIAEFSEDYLKWPDVAKLEEMALDFKMKGAIPGVVGAVDGSYIYINKPSDGQER